MDISSAHLHLLLNHFPVVGTIIILLVVGYGIIRKNKEVIRVGLMVTVVIAIISIFAFITGDGAEQMVEGMDDVSEEYIDEHEDSAVYALIVMEILGGAALIGLFLFRKTDKYPAWYIGIIILFLVVTLAAMARTANLGGKIHHPEIHKDSF